MFERFTARARKVLVLAQEEARYFNHNYIGTEHLLLGLLREEEGVAAQALSSLNVTEDKVRKEVEAIVGIVELGEEETSAQAPFTPRSKKVLELALREALQLGHNYIGTEHILLALVREGEGLAAHILAELGLKPDVVRREVVRRLGKPGLGRPRQKNPNPFAPELVHDELWERHAKARMAKPKKHPTVSMRTFEFQPLGGASPQANGSGSWLVGSSPVPRSLSSAPVR